MMLWKSLSANEMMKLSFETTTNTSITNRKKKQNRNKKQIGNRIPRLGVISVLSQCFRFYLYRQPQKRHYNYVREVNFHC